MEAIQSRKPIGMAATPSKPFSISFGSSRPKQPPPLSKSKKRPHSALADPDSDHEDHAEPQIVTGFDQSSGGAISISAAPVKEPLIIQAQKNRDWREESRRKRSKNLLPAEVQAARDGRDYVQTNGTTECDEVSLEAGLKFVTRDTEGDTLMSNGDSPAPTAIVVPAAKQSVDEEAMEALLGQEKKSTLVIPATESTYEKGTTNGHAEPADYLNEDDRFKADVASRPDAASLDDYDRVPVEEFGSAMLRGMGWKEGQVFGKAGEKAGKERVVERRPALLGIGAKETPGAVGDELGAWGKAAKGKRKTDQVYNPIVLKNAKTGEMLTEEELELKKVESKKGKDSEDWRDRRDRNLAVDREKKRGRLAIEDDKNGDHRRRHRSRSPDRPKHNDSTGDANRSGERSRHSSSRRRRSRSVDRNRHGSSRRERSKSRERNHGRRDYDDYDRRDRNHERRDRDYHRR